MYREHHLLQEGGTAAGSVLAVDVLAASTATGNNTEGLPSNPNLSTGAGERIWSDASV